MLDRLLEMTREETRAKMAFAPGEETRLTGAYLGQAPPGTTPALFVPGIASVYGSDENTLTITPDGREIYFGKEAAIWVCRLTAAGWAAPQRRRSQVTRCASSPVVQGPPAMTSFPGRVT